MVKSQTLITNFLLLLSSIAAVSSSRSTTLSRRGLSANCDPLLGDCSDDQWPNTNFSPITSTNPFTSRPFLRRQNPPYIFPSAPPSVVVPSPPPPVFTNPSFTLAPDDTNPSFSPLVASPPPPGETVPSVYPELPPADDNDDGGDSTINAAAPPFFELSFSPPADDDSSNDLPPPPEVTLPPIVDENQPDVFMSPPQQNWPAPGVFNVPPPPLVAVDSHLPEDDGQLPLQQQPEESVMSPPVDENAKTEPQLPPVVQAPPSA